MQGSFSVRWQGITIVDTVVSYAISASNEYAPSGGWSPIVVKTTKDMPYLWTRTVTTYNDGSTNTAYSVSRQGTDGSNGTSFTPKGVALGHYSNMSSLLASIKSFSVGDKYILDKCSDGSNVNHSISKPCVVVYMDAPDYDWYATQADEGDGYNVGGTLYVNNGEKWVDFGDIQGPAGEDGHNLQLFVSPTKFVFDTDAEGNIVDGGYVRFTYAGKFGDEVITDNTVGAEFSISEYANDYSNFYTRFAGLYENEQTTQGYFQTDGIKKFEYEVAGKKMYAPATSAFFTINLTYKGFFISQRIDIVCNLALLNYSFVQDRYHFQSLYDELDKQQTEHATVIFKQQTQIFQNANDIKLSATKTELNEAKDIVSKQVSEIDVKADGITTRVERVEDGLTHKAEISATVQKDADGNIESGVKIYADQIELTAEKKLRLTAGTFEVDSPNFKIDASGNVSMTGKITATSGSVGGFDIDSNSIGSTSFDPFLSSGKDQKYKMFLTDTFIQFQNNNGFNGNLASKFGAIIGTDAASTIPHRLLNLTAEMESVDSLISAAYINVKNYSGSVNSITSRTGLLIDVSGGGYNYALYAKNGNVLVNGVNSGFKYSCIYLSKANTAYTSSELNVKDNIVWYVECRATGTILVLPTLKSVRAALNIGETDKFSIRLTVIAARTCTDGFDLYGRRVNSSYSSTDYPIFLNFNAVDDDHWGMTKGDVCEVQLTYDGSLYFAQLLVLNR